MGLSACSAGQITQTQPEFGGHHILQGSTGVGASYMSPNNDITLSNVHLVLATEQELTNNNPFHLIFHAANANVDSEYPLQKITIDGVPVSIRGGPVVLCGGRSLATRTPRQIQNALTGSAQSDVASGPATRTADSSCSPFADGGIREASAEAPSAGAHSSTATNIGDTLESLSTLTVDPIYLPDTHRSGTSVDVTFRFAGIEPMTFPIPVTVPSYWDREDVR